MLGKESHGDKNTDESGIVPTYFEEFYFDCVDLYESLSDLKWLNVNQSYARRSPYRS